MPKSATPALFETTVRFFVPARRTAAIRFSGMPHSPKPPIRIVAPSRKPCDGRVGVGYSFVHCLHASLQANVYCKSRRIL